MRPAPANRPRHGAPADRPRLDARHAALLGEIRRLAPDPPPPAARIHPLLRIVAQLGRGTLAAGDEALRLLAFYGQVMLALGRVALRPAALARHLEQTCSNALPIVGLIAFLIGIVMAYQAADQLRRFGAEMRA